MLNIMCSHSGLYTMLRTSLTSNNVPTYPNNVSPGESNIIWILIINLWPGWSISHVYTFIICHNLCCFLSSWMLSQPSHIPGQSAHCSLFYFNIRTKSIHVDIAVEHVADKGKAWHILLSTWKYLRAEYQEPHQLYLLIHHDFPNIRASDLG